MNIYKVTCLINKKIYIGQDSLDRLNYYGSGIIQKAALKKYGKKNFRKEIIEYCGSKTDMDDAEIFWIQYYNTTNRKIGYNIAEGGGGTLGLKPMLGKKFTEEHKQKLRDANLGKKRSIATKQKISMNHGMKGKHHTKESKLRISKKNKEYYKTHDRWNKGKKLSKEHCRKLSKSKKGLIPWNKGIKTGYAPWKDKKLSKQHRKNISESLKGKSPWNKGIKKCFSEVSLQKISSKLKGRKQSKEHIEKKSKSATKFHIQKKDLFHFYIIEKKTGKEISEIYGCSNVTIYNNLRKYNIKTRV